MPTPNISIGQIAIDPTNKIFYFRKLTGELVSTTLDFLQNGNTEIVTSDNVTITASLTVDGNLTVNGTTTTINTETVLIEDNIIVLNSNVSATPSTNAGIEIERGTSPNVSIRWNESSDKWQFTNDGTNFYDINSITEDSVQLGYHTTGDYVENLNAGTGVSITSGTGEGSNPTISIGQDVSTSATPTFAGVTAPLTGNVTGTVSSIANHSIDSLSDVVISSATPNQVLKFNGTNWVNGTSAEVYALNDLSDVIISSPEEFQTLEYDGTNWINKHASVVSYVRNVETTTITTGTVVYLFGSTGDHATVKRADNSSDVTSSKTVGVAGANIIANGNGPVVTRGYVDGINLSTGYTAGDVLWLGSNGQFTTTKPSAPNHLVFIGVVVRATNNGIIYVATQNGYEIDELHDVSIISKTPGDFLKYNGSLWVNDQINLGTDTTGNYVQSLVAGTGVTLTDNSGEGATPTIAIGQAVGTTDNPTFAGATIDAVRVGITAANEIDTTSGNLTIDSTGGTTTIDDNLVVTGNLTVSGTTTTINTTTLSVADNVVTLNSDFTTGSPTENAGIEVLRGSSATVAIRWNETNDKWESTNDGTTYGNVVTTADSGTVTSTMIADGTIVNADINASAAIALSKLASGTSGQIVLANASGVPTYTTVSGKVTINSSGVTSINATLDDLSDVVITSPTLNQVVLYNGSAWVNGASPGGGGGTSASPTSEGIVYGRTTLSTGTTFLGYSSGNTSVSGSDNIAIGRSSQSFISTGSDNIAIGGNAGLNLQTGSNNIFIGRGAGAYNTTGSGNVFIGYAAGDTEYGSDKLYIANSNTSSPLIKGDFASSTVDINGSLTYRQAFNNQGINTSVFLSSSDKGKVVTFNTSSNVTVYVNTFANLVAGERIDLLNLGTGTVSISGSGVTVNGTPGLKLRAQYSAGSLLCIANNSSYVLIGDLAA